MAKVLINDVDLARVQDATNEAVGACRHLVALAAPGLSEADADFVVSLATKWLPTQLRRAVLGQAVVAALIEWGDIDHTDRSIGRYVGGDFRPDPNIVRDIAEEIVDHSSRNTIEEEERFDRILKPFGGLADQIFARVYAIEERFVSGLELVAS